jgi:hypothetical protein
VVNVNITVVHAGNIVTPSRCHLATGTLEGIHFLHENAWVLEDLRLSLFIIFSIPYSNPLNLVLLLLSSIIYTGSTIAAKLLLLSILYTGSTIAAKIYHNIVIVNYLYR